MVFGTVIIPCYAHDNTLKSINASTAFLKEGLYFLSKKASETAISVVNMTNVNMPQIGITKPFVIQ